MPPSFLIWRARTAGIRNRLSMSSSLLHFSPISARRQRIFIGGMREAKWFLFEWNNGACISYQNKHGRIDDHALIIIVDVANDVFEERVADVGVNNGFISILCLLAFRPQLRCDIGRRNDVSDFRLSSAFRDAIAKRPTLYLMTGLLIRYRWWNVASWYLGNLIVSIHEIGIFTMI